MAKNVIANEIVNEVANDVIVKSASRNTVEDTVKNAEAMEGKTERVKSELAKAYERAEAAALELFRTSHLSEVQNMMAKCITKAIADEAENMTKRELAAESKTLTQIINEGKAESKGFTVRFSDTEKDGIIEVPAETLHDMFNAAKQSMLKVKMAERERKAAEAAAAEAKRLELAATIGVTPEMLAQLKELGVIK